MRVATWNINSLNIRLPHVIDWLGQQEHVVSSAIDILCLQELKLPEEKYPLSALEEIGYSSVYCGQKTYNGVAILVKKSTFGDKISDVTRQIPGFDDAQQRVISATIGSGTSAIRIVCAYVPNGEAPGTEKFSYKQAWLDAFHRWLSQEINKYPRLAVMGDFNIAPADNDVHDPVRWVGHNLVSPEERAAFKKLEALPLQDAFRLFPQEEKQFSWWDYRQGAVRRNAGLRIDHILLSSGLAQLCTACSIDKEPRFWERPSDHTPVCATFNDI